VKLQPVFHQKKIAQLQSILASRGIDVMLVSDPLNIFYLGGFYHTPGERPIVLGVPGSGQVVLYVPRLEVEHALEGWLKNIECYFEYPGVTQPLDWIAGQVAGTWSPKVVATDNVSHGSFLRLTKGFPKASVNHEPGIIAEMRAVKEPEEVVLLKKSAEYCDYGLEVTLELLRSGREVSEVDVWQHVSDRIMQRMRAEIKEIVYVGPLTRGLICSGPRSAFPHGLTSSRKIQRGDTVICSYKVFIGAYQAESERTFIIGTLTSEHRRFFDLMCQAQRDTRSQIRDGASCSEIDRKCLGWLRDQGCEKFLMHRTGHGMGLSKHELPWLEEGYREKLRPGNFVSCEPGLYVPGIGGFRHSDSILVTPGGAECLTSFTRDAEALTVK